MKVAHILRKYDPNQWGGTETAVLRLIQGLNQHQITSTVHAPRSTSENANDPLQEIGTRVQRYRAFVPVSGISKQQCNELISWGGNLFSWELFLHLLQDSGDVIHSHAINRIAGIGLRVARWKRIPHVVTLHGGAMDIPTEVSEKLTEPLQGGWEWGKALGALVQSRRVLEITDAIFTCNPQEARLLQARYPQQRIMVQPHSVPASHYAQDHRDSALRAFPQIAGRDLLIKVARLDPAKNLPWLVRQLPEIKRRHPNAMLALVGAETTQSVVEELKQTITQLGLENDVLLTGGLTSGSPELIGLIQQARIFVLCSTAEPFGIVILEAWAAGTPVIASRTSGPIALIEPGRTGLLFDLEKPNEFHQAIDSVLLHSDQALHLRNEAQSHVLAQFDVPQVASRVAKVYEELKSRTEQTTFQKAYALP